MQIKPSLFLVCTATLIGLTLAPPSRAADNELKARVVLFIPEDAKPPEHYQQRIASLAVRTEAFFAHWMKHWKRPIERKRIFARTEGGEIEVTLVRGRLTSKGRNALPAIRKMATDSATQKLGLKRSLPIVWWILYDYPEIRGFQGGAQGPGGIAINAYPKGTELITKDAELAAPKLAEMSVKGTIHEFGHALGLPHIGPRPDVKLGNSLMGPVNRAYWSNIGTTNEPRVYLTEASAAMLWKHPIFQSTITQRYRSPKNVEVKQIKATESDDGSKLIVEGQFSASIPAHTAVILDSERGRFGDYWARSYVSVLDAKTGQFRIVVTRPFSQGTLYLSFCFENGVNMSDNKSPFQRGSSIQISYKGEKGSRRIVLPR